MNATLPKRTLNYLAGGAPTGNRNKELLAAACQFRDAGVPRVEAERELVNRAVRDGLSEHEALGTIASGYSGSARAPIKGPSSQGEPREPSPEEKERMRQQQDDARLRARTLAGRAALFDQFSFSTESFFESSPVSLAPDCQDDWRLLLKLFLPSDIVWIGRDIRDSASPHHAHEWIEFCRTRFLPVSDWLKKDTAPGSFTCPNPFKPGSFSRSNENVIAAKYLVVESDTLDKQHMASLLNWLRTFLTLRAIVDTAGKSLHGWFDHPNPETFRQLKIILPALGCDDAMFKPSQPCRLPGALRDGKYQSLLYLNLQGAP